MPVSWIVVVGVLWVVVLGLAAMVVGLSRRLRELAEVAPGGANQPQTPFVVGPPIDIQLTLPPALASTVNGSAQILLFLHASCGPCRLLWDDLAAAGESGLELDGVAPTVITDPDGQTVFTGQFEHSIVVQEHDELSQSLQINASPYGIGIDADGFVRWSGIPHTRQDLTAMARATARPREELLPTVMYPPSLK